MEGHIYAALQDGNAQLQREDPVGIRSPYVLPHEILYLIEDF